MKQPLQDANGFLLATFGFAFDPAFYALGASSTDLVAQVAISHKLLGSGLIVGAKTFESHRRLLNRGEKNDLVGGAGFEPATPTV